MPFGRHLGRQPQRGDQALCAGDTAAGDRKSGPVIGEVRTKGNPRVMFTPP